MTRRLTYGGNQVRVAVYGTTGASDAILIEECSTNEPKVRTEKVTRDDFCIHSSEVDLDSATARIGRGGRGRDGLG